MASSPPAFFPMEIICSELQTLLLFILLLKEFSRGLTGVVSEYLCFVCLYSEAGKHTYFVHVPRLLHLLIHLKHPCRSTER